MSEFKVGDKVKIIGNSNCHGFRMGETVVIVNPYNAKQSLWHCVSEDDDLNRYLVSEIDMRHVEDDAATDTNVARKSRLAEALGVEEDEEWGFPYMDDVQCRIHEGAFEVRVAGCKWYEPDYWTGRLGWLINHPEEINRSPRLTEAELAICKAVGAKWVSRNKVGGYPLHLWNAKPAENDSCYFNGNAVSLATVDEKLFPSVKPGDCICVGRGTT